MPEIITYRFYEGAGKKVDIELRFDDRSFAMMLPTDAEFPEWTRLEFQKCRNCNLEGNVAYCPAAQAIAHFLPAFADALSYTKAVVEVDTPNRIIVSKTTLQSAVASLMGLAMATSGCPRTDFLRPMARFHLPFATDAETVFRSLGTWLLGEHIRGHTIEPDGAASFDGLRLAYEQLSIVNACFAERLRAAVTRDAALNAILVLDTMAQVAGLNLDGSFEDIRHAFRLAGSESPPA